jgi:hypothetical protein
MCAAQAVAIDTTGPASPGRVCHFKYQTRTDHSEALIVRGTGYYVGHLDQPRASLSLSADIHLNELNNSYGRM